MGRRRIRRNALNRGSAVWLGGSRVRFLWACGCSRVETMETGEQATRLLVKNWRANGVVLEQCKRHPEWYSRLSQVPRLNAEHPG